MAKGMYEIDRNTDDVSFNIKPKDAAGDIPDDQRQIHHGIYKAYNALKLLAEHKIIDRAEGEFAEFRERLLEVAEVGLAAKNVKTREAAAALKDIQIDILTRKGKRVVYSYLFRLGYWALSGLGFGLIVYFLLKTYLVDTRGYGLVICGAMVGAWLSVAATRTRIELDAISEFLDYGREPIVRLVFVILLSVALALLLQEGLITIKIGSVDFADFKSKASVALILGVVIGVSEKALSLKFIERVKTYVVK